MSIDRVEESPAERGEAAESPGSRPKRIRLKTDGYRLHRELWRWQGLSIKQSNGAVDFAYPSYEQMVSVLADPNSLVGPCERTIRTILADLAVLDIIEIRVSHDDEQLRREMYGFIKLGYMKGFGGGQLPNAYRVKVAPDELRQHVPPQDCPRRDRTPSAGKTSAGKARRRRPCKPERPDQPDLFSASESPGGTAELGGKVCRPSPANLAAHGRQTLPPNSSERPYRDELTQQQQTKAADADVVVVDQVEKALADVVGRPVARELMRLNPEVVPVALAHWRKQPGVKEGLLVEFIRDPEGRRFTRDADGWHPPRAPGAAADAPRRETDQELHERIKQERERNRNL